MDEANMHGVIDAQGLRLGTPLGTCPEGLAEFVFAPSRVKFQKIADVVVDELVVNGSCLRYDHGNIT